MGYYTKKFTAVKDSISVLDYTADIPYRDKTILADKQNEVFRKYLENVKQPGTYLISTQYNTSLLKAASSEIVKKATEEEVFCYEYNIIKNRNDEDRYLKEFLLTDKYLDLLIISGVFVNRNINNVDKLRELIETYEDIAKVILISGGIGYQFFEERVNLPYNKFIHFNDVVRKRVKQF